MEREAIRRRERLYVGGEWVTGPDTFPVTDLADGGTFAEVAAADADASVNRPAGATQD